MPIRRPVNASLVPNFDFEFAPPGNTPTSANNVYINNTAGGTSLDYTYKWGMSKGGNASAALFDSSEKYKGTYSLKLSTLAANAFVQAKLIAAAITQRNLYERAIRVLPSTSYTVSFWMKTNLVSGSSASGARMALVQYDSAGNALTTTLTPAVTTTTGWTKYTLTFTTNASCIFIDPQPRVTGNDGAATLIMDAWFDEIYLTPTTPVTRQLV
jgi:mRNA-degrading endonuclease toxin of MazEF toxin-antitoxin module